MRQRIMTAAREAMEQHGVKFTMHDLARQLGVSKRSLYEHFASKEALIGAIVDEHLNEIRRARREVVSNPHLSFVEKLRQSLFIVPQVCTATKGRVASDIKRFMPQEKEKIDRFFDEEWMTLEAMLKEGIDQGEFRPVYLPILQRMIRGTMEEIIEYPFLTEHNISLKEATDCIGDILMNGVLCAGKE
ncbi:MAG: TetR/AcrR family transcriptional regulator [Sporomusaceae bacterium]|nr:TetR/AcrR family transcriptional regulator [Sporomusaceae bacterium]